MDDKLYIKIASDPPMVTAVPKDNAVTIESVTYTRR
jgi:hypothetical protein